MNDEMARQASLGDEALPERVLVEEVEHRWRDDEYSVDTAVVAERAQTREELEDALDRLPFIFSLYWSACAPSLVGCGIPMR